MCKLTLELKKISSNVIYATSTNSTYFIINNIKIRLSNHFSTNSDADLLIFHIHNSYTIIPMKVVNKQVLNFTNIRQVIEFIHHFAKISILYKTPQQLTLPEQRDQYLTFIEPLLKGTITEKGIQKGYLCCIYDKLIKKFPLEVIQTNVAEIMAENNIEIIKRKLQDYKNQ